MIMTDGTIGYSKDGIVFFVVELVSDGQKKPYMKIWEPQYARIIASKLLEAADGAEREAKGQMQ